MSKVNRIRQEMSSLRSEFDTCKSSFLSLEEKLGRFEESLEDYLRKEEASHIGTQMFREEKYADDYEYGE